MSQRTDFKILLLVCGALNDLEPKYVTDSYFKKLLEQLTNKYNLTKQDFFCFLQIRHYITHSTTLIVHPEISAIERMLFQQKLKVSLSSLYGVLNGLSAPDTRGVRGVWEEELSVTLDEEIWNSIWVNAKKISICTRARAIQLKIMHRLHISPHRRHLFNRSLSPLCLKCKTNVGTLTHCFWSCHKLQQYWTEIIREIESILHINIDMDPSKHARTSTSKRLYNILTFAARKNILLQWVSDKAPSVSGWQKIISELIPLEYLTGIMHSSVDQFFRVWQPYLNYIGHDLSSTLLKGILYN